MRLLPFSMRMKSAPAEGGEAVSSSSKNMSVPKDMFELSEQLERQAGIIANISGMKKKIIDKQTEGRELAVNVADENLTLEKHLENKK